jgi:subtilisin-like proprotein convertase family protein
MSRFKVLSTAAALVIAGCISTPAQLAVTNIFENVNKVIPDGQVTGVSDTQVLSISDPLFTSVGSVQVNLTIANGYNGDFYAYLVHDTGFAVLLNRVGRTDSNLTGYNNPGMSVTLSDGGNDIHSYQSFSLIPSGDPLTGIWAPDGREADPRFVMDTDDRTALLGSFGGTDPNGAWTLFLADLDFGEQGTLVQWGLVITAIPEPSSWTLLALGGVAMGARFLRRRRSK